MDIATLIGLIGAFAIVLMAMALGGSIAIFVNVPSLLIVLVGSIFVVLMKFTLGQFLGAAKIATKAFMFKIESPVELIQTVVELAESARKGGLLALEGSDIENGFLNNGVQLLVDGHEPDVVRSVLSNDMKLTEERHEWGGKIFTALGDVGPAMGMIGTLVGLVAMLSNMSDPKAIGPAMAVALLTTLYGAMFANMFALPIADKLKLRMVEEKRNKALMIDALLAIQAGQNPRVIESMLKTYLPGAAREEAAVE
ncbi:MAG: flagellar motor protein PomA [Pseudomonadota bacterium]|nr:flagellar motor protein PomA [Pseudomonadota bacterium]